MHSLFFAQSPQIHLYDAISDVVKLKWCEMVLLTLLIKV